jgi:predicted DNA-binding protein YlxM (UPF0122 family)
MNLNQDQLVEIERLSGLNYSLDEIAMYLDVDRIAFFEEFNLPDSQVAYTVQRGKLLSKAQVEQELLKSAKNGNITAIQILEKKTKDFRLTEIRKQIDADFC